MLIVVANDLPPVVRGRMKLWFIEPRPNIFVSGIKDSVATTVIEYLYKHCPPEAGIMLIRSITDSPGFQIRSIGPPRKKTIKISGFELIVETLHDDQITKCST